MSDLTSAAETTPATTGVVQPGDRVDGQTLDEQQGKPRSLGKDAWLDLRTNWIFLVSATLILILILMAAFPSLFTSRSPADADLAKSLQKPSAHAWFGYDLQGKDIYTLTIYGARASIIVGVLATLATLVVGAVAGMVAGYSGGWIDSVVSRFTDVFFAIPLLLGSILVVFAFPITPGTPSILIILRVVAALSVLGWTYTARIMRSSVIQVKQADYVQAARALGAGPLRIVLKHILPNALAPVIVVSTISLGGYIAAEATLSFLGLGLTPPVVSWGVAISDATVYVRSAPHLLLFPSLFLSITVLAFIMLGDAARDALDPKLR
ncbi:MAG: ABC transporter permease [Mycobacteriales bacterium]